jgi:DNA-binding SARP family transcriptional activator
MPVEFQLLGPIEARDDGRSLALSGPRRKALLARLLLDQGRMVSSDQLMDDVWDGQRSPGAAATLQSHISQLRKVLGDRLRSRGAGYLLDLTDAVLDVADFERFADAGAAQLASGDPVSAHAAFDRGLALWHGRALQDVADRQWAAFEAARLEDRRAIVVEDDLKARLELGRPEEVVHLAKAAVAMEPLRESRWAHLITALYRCGRQADALDAARRVRELLSDELGIDPSPMLATLEIAVLNQDPGLLGPVPPGRASNLLAEARAAARRRRWAEAARLLQAADAAQPLGPEELDWLGQAAFLSSNVDLAVSANQRAHIAWLERHEPRRAAVSAMALVANHFIRNRPAIALGWFHRGRRLLEREPEGPEHGVAAFTRCLIALSTGDLDVALTSSIEARELGAHYRVSDVEALGLSLQGATLIRRGAISEGIGLLDEALTFLAADQLGPVAAGLMFCRILQALIDIADLDRANQWVEAITARGADDGEGGFPGDCRVHRAELLCGLGRWDEAEQEARAACKEVQDFDLLHAGIAHAQLGTVRLARGDLAGAETSFAHAVACGASAQPGLALLHLAQGDLEAAAASMRAALADTRLDSVTRGRLLPAAVDIALAIRDETAAEQAAVELQGLAERYATPVLQASAATVRGALALYRGDCAASVHELRVATHIWLELRAPGQVGPARLRLAEALDALGDRAGAELERASAHQVGTSEKPSLAM